MRILKRLLLATVAVFCCLIGFLAFLVSSETGLHTLLKLTQPFTATMVSIGSASGSLLGPLTLNKVQYNDGINTVTVDRFRLDWQPGKLFKKQLILTSLAADAIDMRTGKTENEKPEPQSVTATLPAFSLPIDIQLKQLDINDLSLHLNGAAPQHIDHVGLRQLSARGDQFRLAALNVKAQENILKLKAALRTNTTYPIEAALTAHLVLPEFAPIDTKLELTGPLNNLKLRADLLQPAMIELDGSLNDLLSAPRWTAALHSERIALAAINKTWPQEEIKDLHFQGKGTFTTYEGTLQAKTTVPGAPALLQFDTALAGNTEGVQITRMKAVQDKAQLALQGELKWSPALSWKAELQGQKIDPSAFLAEWPGNFSTNLSTQGTLDRELQMQLQLHALNGTLRGYPLQGKGSMRLQGDQLELPNLSLKSGTSRLHIQGTSSPKLDLNLDIDSPNLAELLPQASGTLKAKAQLTGSLKKPNLDLRLNGQDIEYQDMLIGHVEATANGLITQEGALKAKVTLAQADLAGTELDSSVLSLNGTLKKHQLHFEAQNSDLQTGLELVGGYRQGTWQGNLQNAYVNNERWDQWQQKTPSSLLASSQEAKLTQTCLATSSESSICLQGEWRGSNQHWKVTSTVTTLPLPALAGTLNAPWPVEGSLNTFLEAQGNAAQIRQATLRADTDGLVVTAPLPDGTEQELAWTTNTFKASYADNLLSGTLLSRINKENGVQLNLRQKTANPVADLMTQPLQATLDIDLQDLQLLTALTQQAVIPEGALQGRWTMQGLIKEPNFSGQIVLKEGKAEIPPLGITLSPLELTLKGKGQKIQLQALAHSGTGELQADTTVDLLQTGSQTINVLLEGENFHAASLPGMDLTVSPDLQVHVSDQEIKVQGGVDIPQAKLSSIDFDQATAPSSDVVIVDEGPLAPAAPQPLYLDLAISIGKEVKIDAFGLRANIEGNLHIDGQPGRPMIGTGTLAVNDGTFTLYGKRLNIDVGRVLYTASPLDNPGIELRSERKTEKATTGLTVEGFLQHPEISFYSTPAMQQAAIIQTMLQDTAIGGETRDDIGSVGTVAEKIGMGGLVPYLRSLKKFSMIDEIKIEDGDDDEDQSLVLGSWLTPDLYVSYGKSLGEDASSFNTKLNLGHGFSLLTETGAESSGSDIKFEFEH
ncbi:translocation/assembly module TamB domain-containing protein [Desulfobulbus rhabdoformis]|uniref:translocation/assembly module TamB domain-containing protein n=1 Tax=Desulfobulbus rhabdoformis TaxID=34032 RepID=UPI0019641096|nr:translocation/assembly module TamB domain-containing protein [Desulfobulbus rhabdoformis]MBM9616251.1 translocation/assembly module TamB domain-containing protein [Desulfobulbus rhabdoformis]